MNDHDLQALSSWLRPAGGGVYLVSTGAAAQRALQRRVYGVTDDAQVHAAFLARLPSLQRARVVILGVPSDTGAGFRRGANLGPQALREAWLAARPSLPADLPAADVVDVGDVFVVPQLQHDEMCSTAQLEASRQALYGDVDPDVSAGWPVAPLSIAERAMALILAHNPDVKFLVLGGDHSTAWPATKALYDAGRRFCILQFDAHTDLLEHRLGVRLCFATWSFHANELLGRRRRLIQVGVRASRFPRVHWEQTLDVAQFWADDVRADPAAAVERIVDAVKATGLPCLLSNDIDGTDAAFASATGTPEPQGIHPDFVVKLIERLGAEVGLVSADLMEVAPMLESEAPSTTLQTAVRYLDATLAALVTTGQPASLAVDKVTT
jgi:arginase family enzyme